MTAPSALLRILLVALLAALVAPGPAAAKRKDFVGLSSEDTRAGSGSYRAKAFAAQRAAGVQLIRQNFDWASVERSPGRYTFVEYDPYVAAAARSKLRLLPVLYHPPSFRSSAPRSGAQRGEYPPRNYDSMGVFAATLVRRYGPKGSFWRAHPELPYRPIRAWQVWNEPSLRFYWRPRPNAVEYVRLLRVVGRWIKAADRRAEIVTAGIPYTQMRSAVPLGRFLKRMYRAGAKGSFKTLAINAYSKNKRELRRTLRRVRRIMRRNGDRRRRIWITELGWATAGPKHRLVVGSAQGRRIRSTFRWIKRNRKRYRIRGIVYYQWRDQRPYPPAFKDMWGLHTGLVNVKGRPKPGLRSFRRMARRLR